MAEGKKGEQTDEDILKEARSRFKDAIDADNDNRIAALDDLKFAWNYQDYQWPQDIKRLRKGRPCLTENRIPQFIRQVVNTQRSNRPSIEVSPVNSGGDPKVALVIEGMIKHIEQWSRADLAYDSAFEAAVTTGAGYFRVTTEYADDKTLDQDICIRPIENPFSVYDDHRYTLPDASDRRYCFVTEMVDRKDFEDEYGFEPTPVDEVSRGDDMEQWFEKDRVRVAEYWRVCTERSTVKLPDPMGGEEQERQVEKKYVEQYLMTGDKIIRKADWSGVYIPIIPVYGAVTNIEGKKLRKSLIRDAKDAQRINNYWLSTETEAIALQPKAPWIGPVGSFETDEQKWANSNTENHAYLQYDAVEGGAAPMRVEPPAFPSAIRETRMAAIESMKAIMGIYDASLGAKTNETSGVAIQERQEQGDNSNYHLIDNMTRAIRYAGLVILDLLPHVFDTPRVTRIISPDDSATMVAINTVFIDPTTGQAGSFDLQAGKYDVVVKAGPSFQTQRQEAAKAISALVTAYPPLIEKAGDLLLKNMDFPDADKIAERLAPQGGLPPQVQQQMQQMQQIIQQGKGIIEELHQKLNMQELKLEQSKIEKMQLQVQLKDKGGQIIAGQQDTHAENQRFIIDALIRLMALQQKQQMPVTQEAAQMEPQVAALVQ